MKNMTSTLDDLIAPEIKDDESYSVLGQIAGETSIRTLLEIGSSAGDGRRPPFSE